jgi:hypothetical protein
MHRRPGGDPVTAYGVIPGHGDRGRWREIGRAGGTWNHLHGHVPRTRAAVRVATNGTDVMIGVGPSAIQLDAEGREDFARLWFEACRQAEEDASED